jgi:hypothetical protein
MESGTAREFGRIIAEGVKAAAGADMPCPGSKIRSKGMGRGLGVGGGKGPVGMPIGAKGTLTKRRPKQKSASVKAPLSKEAKELRGVLEKSAFGGGLGRRALARLATMLPTTIGGGVWGAGVGGIHGALRKKDPGETRLKSVLRSALTGAGTGAGIGAGFGAGLSGIGPLMTGNPAVMIPGMVGGGLLGHRLARRPEKAPEKSAAHELGRLIGTAKFTKVAGDREFAVRVAAFKLLAKKAGYKDNDINALVKSASMKKKAQGWLPYLLGAGGLGAGAAGIYGLGKNMGWWGQKKPVNPYVQRIQQLAEARDAAQKAGMSWLGPQPPGVGGAGGAGGAGGGYGMNYGMGKVGPKWNAQTRQLFSRAGIDPEQERGTLDAIQAMQYGGIRRQQRGRELAGLARLGTGMGVAI